MSNSQAEGHGGSVAAVVLAVLIAVHTLFVVWPFAASSAAVDFFTFWSVPHTRAAAADGNIYQADAQRAMFSALARESQTTTADRGFRRGTELVRELYGERVDATGSPLLYTLVAAISSGSFDADAPRYMALSFAALAASVFLLARLAGFGATATLLVLALVFSNFSPVISDVMVGNINALQLLAVALFAFWWARDQPMLAGAALGAGSIVKPTVALVVVLAAAGVLAKRDRPRAVSFLGGVAIAVVLGIAIASAYFGRLGIWVDFLVSLGRTLGPGTYTIDSGNFSAVALVAGRTATPVGAMLLVGLTALGAWLAARASRASGTTPPREALFAAGWGTGAVLLASPLAWLHYYTLLLPAIFGGLQAARGDGNAVGGGWMRQVVGFVPLALLSASAETLMGDNRRGEGVLVNVAVVLALTTLAVRMWSSRPVTGAREPVARERKSRRKAT